jgi:hypothetical protein
MKTLANIFKTRTANGRLSKTTVFMPEKNMVVINRLILAKEEDIKEGWFAGAFPIYVYKDYILMQSEMVFWVESFNMIQEAFKKLNEQWTK